MYVHSVCVCVYVHACASLHTCILNEVMPLRVIILLSRAIDCLKTFLVPDMGNLPLSCWSRGVGKGVGEGQRDIQNNTSPCLGYFPETWG